MPSSACKKKKPRQGDSSEHAQQPVILPQDDSVPAIDIVEPTSPRHSRPRHCPARRLSLCFFNDPATTEIYTLSLHDALPIRAIVPFPAGGVTDAVARIIGQKLGERLDRKSTRLNSSHVEISYAVFCLKK